MDGGAPNIRGVSAEADHRLLITWKGGSESVVDIDAHLHAFAIFSRLRKDGDLFRRVTVGEWGWCVRWSDDLEISADTIWRLALAQGAAWLRDWRGSHRMTQAEAARALGVSPRMWRYYEAGEHLLPKTVRLAGVGLDALEAA